MAICRNRPYGKIASDSVRTYGGRIDSYQVSREVCQVRKCTEVCPCVVSVRRRHGGKVAPWCHCGAPGGTVAGMWHGGRDVARWCSRLHGGVTVAHQVSLRHGCGMVVASGTVVRCDKWHGGMVARSHGFLVTWRHVGTKGRWICRTVSGGDQMHGAMETRSHYKCSLLCSYSFKN